MSHRPSLSCSPPRPVGAGVGAASDVRRALRGGQPSGDGPELNDLSSTKPLTAMRKQEA